MMVHLTQTISAQDNPYPTAPIILADQPTQSPALQLTIGAANENNDQPLMNAQQETVYYLCTTPKETLLYDASRQPLWQADHQSLTFTNQQKQDGPVIQLTPPLFRFTMENQTYHWQSIENGVACYHTETKLLVAHLDQHSLSVYHNSHNPFRQASLLVSLVILSGWLVYIVSCHDEKEDDITSLSSVYHYPGHHSLVGDASMSARWSTTTTQSFKSIELDPGIWHCWWGYRFWWSWLPCCMPGGCCDRGCIYIRGYPPKSTLSRQGWQQQSY
ncbi:hypothetical protein BD560DRAFT_391880 [Blakeslea trispora]|nr:hypothetical protein BD560DRAFT_391880 [Blakeslea trispora]